MPAPSLRRCLADRENFVVVAELTGAPGYNPAPIVSLLRAARDDAGRSLPADVTFAAAALPQSPGGVANLEPGDVISTLRAEGLHDTVDLVPHVTCKDHNLNALTSTLVGYRNLGIGSLLALTGDKPLGARGVFELDSVGLLDLIGRLNREVLLKAKPGRWDGVPQFLAGAAVSPFKYTEASQMQQYYKMEKKVRRGADFLITQLGWDWRKSQELMRYIQERDLSVPVIGNVYLLTTKTPAPRLMHTGKLPGCFVSDALYERLQRESFEDHVERAAQQVAMYRDLGAAGVDVGGLPDYETLTRILQRAVDIGSEWVAFEDNLCWPRDDGFYLYDERGQRNALSRPRRSLRQRSFNSLHRHVFTPGHLGTRLARGLVQLTRADREDSLSGHALAAAEKSLKYLVFRCEDCGDCYLPENFGYCTLGRCEKGLSNAPCGDSTVDGCCGNNSDSPCTGELIYQAASMEPEGRERLRDTVLPPRDASLRNTSSWANALCARDHTRSNPLQVVGPALDARLPGTRAALEAAAEAGDWTGDSGALRYLRALIESQAAAGATQLSLRLDDLETAADLLAPCLSLIETWGRGVPVCVETADPELLAAALVAWRRELPPLVRLLDPTQLDAVLLLRASHRFGLVVPPIAQTEGTEATWTEAQIRHVREVTKRARRDHGFRATDLVFEFPVTPLALDLPDGDSRPGRNRLSLEALRGVRAERRLRDTRCAMDVGLVAMKLRRGIGVCRAYLARALEAGLGMAWADATKQYGLLAADPQLLRTVDAFLEQDGSAASRQRAEEARAACLARPKAPAPAPKPAAPAAAPIEAVEAPVAPPAATTPTRP